MEGVAENDEDHEDKGEGQQAGSKQSTIRMPVTEVRSSCDHTQFRELVSWLAKTQCDGSMAALGRKLGIPGAIMSEYMTGYHGSEKLSTMALDLKRGRITAALIRVGLPLTIPSDESSVCQQESQQLWSSLQLWRSSVEKQVAAVVERMVVKLERRAKAEERAAKAEDRQQVARVVEGLIATVVRRAKAEEKNERLRREFMLLAEARVPKLSEKDESERRATVLPVMGVSVNRLSEAELRRALTMVPGLPCVVAERIIRLRPFADEADCTARVNSQASIPSQRLGKRRLAQFNFAPADVTSTVAESGGGRQSELSPLCATALPVEHPKARAASEAPQHKLLRLADTVTRDPAFKPLPPRSMNNGAFTMVHQSLLPQAVLNEGAMLCRVQSVDSARRLQSAIPPQAVQSVMASVVHSETLSLRQASAHQDASNVDCQQPSSSDIFFGVD